MRAVEVISSEVSMPSLKMFGNVKRPIVQTAIFREFLDPLRLNASFHIDPRLMDSEKAVNHEIN